MGGDCGELLVSGGCSAAFFPSKKESYLQWWLIWLNPMIAFLVPMIALWLFRRGLHGMTESKSRLFCFGRLPVSPKKKEAKQTNKQKTTQYWSDHEHSQNTSAFICMREHSPWINWFLVPWPVGMALKWNKSLFSVLRNSCHLSWQRSPPARCFFLRDLRTSYLLASYSGSDAAKEDHFHITWLVTSAYTRTLPQPNFRGGIGKKLWW